MFDARRLRSLRLASPPLVVLRVMAVFSPAESWVLICVIAVFAGFLYWVISRGDDDEDRMSDAWLERWRREHEHE